MFSHTVQNLFHILWRLTLVNSIEIFEQMPDLGRVIKFYERGNIEDIVQNLRERRRGMKGHSCKM